jgi:hypothetical protein
LRARRSKSISASRTAFSSTCRASASEMKGYHHKSAMVLIDPVDIDGV